MRELYEGIFLLGRFGFARCGAWLLQSKGEAALFEMPEYGPREASPVEAAKECLEALQVRLRYVLLSHPHQDHYDSILEYREAFPEATFVGHKIFSYIINYKCSAELLDRRELWKALPSSDRVFDRLFEDDVVELPLGDETISIIYAPKHSPGDTLLHFKEVLFTGDWWMLEGDPGNCEEVARVANESIARVVDTVEGQGLRVRHMFPSHANNFLFDVDFLETMKRTLMPSWRERAKECPVKIIRTI